VTPNVLTRRTNHAKCSATEDGIGRWRSSCAWHCFSPYDPEVNMKSIVLLIATIVMVPAGAASRAQEPQPRDAQSRAEPRSAPGAGQAFLEKMAGEWEVSKVIHPPSGEPVRTSGRCRQTMIQGGRFLQSDFVFGTGQRATTGLGIIGFEPETGRFTSFWVDSRQTRMSARQSREPFDGRKIVLYSMPLDPQGKETRRSKTITQLEDGGRRLVHRQFSLTSSGEERLFMELILTRSR
jgi:hypothetical protein